MATIKIGHNVRHWTTYEIGRDLTPGEEEAILAAYDDGSVELLVELIAELWRQGHLHYLHREEGHWEDFMNPAARVRLIAFNPAKRD